MALVRVCHARSSILNHYRSQLQPIATISTLQNNMPICFGKLHLYSSFIKERKKRTEYHTSKRTIITCNRLLFSKKSPDVMNVFDRNAKRTQRNRTALLKDYEVYDYLKEEVGWRMADRMSDVKRKFEVAVDLGCGRGHIAKHVLLDTVGCLYQCDMAEKVLAQSAASPEVPTHRVVVDEEFFPFKSNSLDLVMSSLSLHWVNDLPGTFRQIHNALKPDGCFMGAMFGGDTLHELRVSLQLAELERLGGFAAHISPFTSPQDLGGLLQRSGYVMLTLDLDEIIINFPSMFELMDDLKGMGESNCAWSRRPLVGRNILTAASAIYKEKFGDKETSSIPAIFQILYFIAWKPDPSQKKAAPRGSGQVSLKDVDKLDEVSRQVRKMKEETKQTTDGKLDRTIEELEKAIEKARHVGQKSDETVDNNNKNNKS